MTKDTDLSAATALKWKTRAVQLMLAVDRIRDGSTDERQMAAAIVSTLADEAEAELVLLCLRDDDTSELQLRAALDRLAIYAGPAQTVFRHLAGRAADLPAGEFLDAEVALPHPDHPRGLCLAAPLRVAGESLGALLLLNADLPFSAEVRELVQLAISQIDSAVQHARTLRDLQRRQRELESVYRIDHLRDQKLDFDVMLDQVLAEVCRTLDAEIGFLMLYDRSGSELELRAATDRDLFAAQDHARLIRAVSDEALRQADLVRRDTPQGALRSVVAMPLILHEHLIGVLGLGNRKGRPVFTRSDLLMLRAIASQIDTAIFESLETLRLRASFGKCVGPRVMERLLSISDRDLLSSERIVVTTLFSDIRGFTGMSEKIDPELLQAVLNDHLSALSGLVLAYEGTLDKYIGDCVMCFFNAPERQPDHARRAVELALEMHQAHQQVMARWQERLPLPPIGIGISTGETMMGNFGSLQRLEYTAIGRHVNLASRLCSAAEGNQTLISADTYDLVRGAVLAAPVPELHLKGIDATVTAWNVRGLA